jgi:dTDP-4-dehydrorhamnose 3,5-epimerase
MRFAPTELPGVILVEPDVHRDPRGFFLETWNHAKYQAGGIAAPFVQTNHSLSMQGTVRGLHAQRNKPQGKLVRCVEGTIFDVAVDIRRSSPTFRRWVGFELSAENFLQLWVPPGFAHGFAVLSPCAQVEYACTDYYDPADEITIAWNDPQICVNWPVGQPVLSARDQRAQSCEAQFELLPP